MAVLFPIYLMIWCLISAINMWVGVTQAGYSVMEESLVFIPVFGVPMSAALYITWRSIKS